MSTSVVSCENNERHSRFVENVETNNAKYVNPSRARIAQAFRAKVSLVVHTHPRLESHPQCLNMCPSTGLKTAQLPCWPSRGHQVSVTLDVNWRNQLHTGDKAHK